MGVLNVKVGNVAVEGIIRGHGVFNIMNGNGKQLEELCWKKD